MFKRLLGLFKIPFLRNIFFLFLLIAILIPLYEQLRAFPAFRDLLTKSTEEQAIRVATHLSSYDFFKDSALDRESSIPEAWKEELTMVSADLKLEKVKVFSKHGLVIFSTDPADLGKINKHHYFHDIVAKGQVYTKVVENNSMSLEGRRLRQTVVETYVPIVRGANREFVGSFEIYYDIAKQRSEMNVLLNRFNLDMIFMGIGLTLLALVLLMRSAKEVKQREAVQAALQLSEEKFRGITDSAKDAILMVDPKGKISFWNRAAQGMFGYSKDEALGQAVFELLAPVRFVDNALKGFRLFAKTGEGKTVLGQTLELVALRKNGQEFPVEISVSAIFLHEEWHAIGILRDITARKMAEQRMKLGIQVMDNAADGIIVTNSSGIIEMVNPAFTQVTGFSSEEVVGQNPNILKSGRHDVNFYQEMWQSLLNKGVWRGEVWNRRKDGGVYPQQLSMSAIYDNNDGISHYVGVFNDISQRKLNEENLERLAFYDPLTGIPNRLLFRERLNQAIREDRRYKTASALLFLDLDKFKQVNDTYGHEIGDLLLQKATERLQLLIRDNDTVSRLGGDEFTVILRRAANIQDAERVAGQIVATMLDPFLINELTCQIGVSIGIAFYPFHADDIDTLIKRADTAMYIAKKGGRNRYHVYEPVTDEFSG
ncbi:MAG: diguanylate cyclase [Magnetococcales bacterium]|nr:diguanylate cyclase [Magnetococcales bacterium]